MLLLLAAAAALLAPWHAGADVVDLVNWARLTGCPGSAAKAPLHNDSRLAAAASRMAAGAALHGSLAAAGYLAVRSAAVHSSGASSDTEVARALTARECDTVADPELTQLGAWRRGRELWLVFAAPAVLPQPTDSAKIAEQILRLVNEARATPGRCGGRAYAAAGPLQLNAALSAAATAHSQDMAARDEFDHRGHDGSTPSMRVTRAGFGAFSIVGENIAAGAMTPDEVTRGWLASPPHCENIRDPRFTELGIGFAVNTANQPWVFWTQDFAGRPR